MHYWGDDWDGWDDLSRVCDEMWTFTRRWGRLGGDIKEKYGTLRFYAKFHHMVHDLIWPGYVYCQWPKWLHFLWSWDCWYYDKYCSRLRYCIVKYQYWIYRLAYRRALRRYPQIRKEILCAADYPELLAKI